MILRAISRINHHSFHSRNPQISVPDSPTSRRLVLLLGLASFLIIPTASYAQDSCADLSNNIEWTSGLEKIIITMQSGDMQQAKQQAKALADICMNAPLLNYLQGKIAEALNEKSDALFYYQKASENNYTFAIAPDVAKKIWYARYENEFPEHTEDVIVASKARIAALEAEIADEKAEIARMNAQRDVLISNFKDREHESIKKMMWAGAGIGIAGVAIAGGGIGMLFGTKHEKYEKVDILIIKSDSLSENNDNQAIQSYTYNPLYITSWALLGAGAALAFTGAILTGIYGYQYTHPRTDESFSLQISPCDISLKITF